MDGAVAEELRKFDFKTHYKANDARKIGVCQTDILMEVANK